MPTPQTTAEVIDSRAKPLGSLGRLEALAKQIAQIQKTAIPKSSPVRMSVFAGNHEVVKTRKVSPFPSDVTALMIKTFLSGKAAVNKFAETSQCELEVIDCGVGVLPPKFPTVPFTAWEGDPIQANDITVGPALSESSFETFWQMGRNTAERAICDGMAICGAGEMGIGNTTPASALYSHFLKIEPRKIVGPGTGLDSAGLEAKVQTVELAIQRVSSSFATIQPKDALRELGGCELTAMTSFFLTLHDHNIPVLVDGFIASASALSAMKINPSCSESFIFSTLSAEPGHCRLFEKLELDPPLLDLGLRLGEGTGACLAVSLVKAACKIPEMASLEEVLSDNLD